MRLRAAAAGRLGRNGSARTCPSASTPAWNGVTFGRALDMATGNYDSAEFEADEDAAKTAGYSWPLDHASKIRFGCDAYPHRAAPGTQWVYHTSDTYVLGTRHGPLPAQPSRTRTGRFVRDLMYAQLYAPLGLSATSSVTRRTYDNSRATLRRAGA